MDELACGMSWHVGCAGGGNNPIGFFYEKIKTTTSIQIKKRSSLRGILIKLNKRVRFALPYSMSLSTIVIALPSCHRSMVTLLIYVREDRTRDHLQPWCEC